MRYRYLALGLLLVIGGCIVAGLEARLGDLFGTVTYALAAALGVLILARGFDTAYSQGREDEALDWCARLEEVQTRYAARTNEARDVRRGVESESSQR